MCINQIITLIKDIIIAICAIGTFSVAVYGVKSWARELKGKADFEISRGLIRAVYKFRDELDYSRSPMTLANEFPSNYDPMNKEVEYRANAWSHVFSNRWKGVVVAIQELEAQGLEAEALWGNEIQVYVKKLRKDANLLRVGMQAIVDNEAQDYETFNTHKELAEEMKSRVWRPIDGNDEISKNIITTVKEIEDFVLPYLKRN